MSWRSLSCGKRADSRNKKQVPKGSSPSCSRSLNHAKSILEGMAIEGLRQNCLQCAVLSLLSLESTWNVISTEEYLQHSKDFRRSINLIKQAAHDKNIDRVALGYVDLTIRCVDCHQYLRKAQVRRPSKKASKRPKKKVRQRRSSPGHCGR